MTQKDYTEIFDDAARFLPPHGHMSEDIVDGGEPLGLEVGRLPVRREGFEPGCERAPLFERFEEDGLGEFGNHIAL